jgi:hypothetical protein
VPQESSRNDQFDHAPVPVAQPVRAVSAQSPRLMVALPLPRSPIAAAAGGLTAGAAFVTLVRVLSRRRAPRIGARRGKDLRRNAVATRSFLVDVHLLR